MLEDFACTGIGAIIQRNGCLEFINDGDQPLIAKHNSGVRIIVPPGCTVKISSITQLIPEEYDSSPFPELSDSEYAEFIKISETMLSEISEKQFQRYKELVHKILFQK